MIKMKIKIEKNFEKMFKCIHADTILIGFPAGIPHDTKQKMPKLEEGRAYSGKKLKQMIKASFGNTMDISDLAAILSFGDANRQGTPFLEDGIRWQKDKLKKLIKLSYDHLVKTGKTLNTRIGVEAVAGVQEYIMGGHSPYKKLPATIKAETARAARLGGEGQKTLPLIDTGDMIGATTFIVKEKKVKIQ